MYLNSALIKLFIIIDLFVVLGYAGELICLFECYDLIN